MHHPIKSVATLFTLLAVHALYYRSKYYMALNYSNRTAFELPHQRPSLSKAGTSYSRGRVPDHNLLSRRIC